MIPVIPRNEIHCAVPSCKNKKSENLSMSYFTFPQDPKKCSKWIKNCGIEGKIDVSKNGDRVCAAHFDNHWFLNISKNRLSVHAVPTLLTDMTKKKKKTVSTSTCILTDIFIPALSKSRPETSLSFTKPSTSRSKAGMSSDFHLNSPFAKTNPDVLRPSAMDLLLRKKAEDEARKRSLKLRAAKAVTLNKYAPEVRKRVDKILDELLCENIFDMHMRLKTGMCDPKQFFKRHVPEEPLKSMAEELDIIKGNQDINCPKCNIVVRCFGLSKHLAVCMNPQQSCYSYSSRNSSRIARQRIQEGFKTSYDESKNDSDDDKVKPKKRNNKDKKNKKKGVK